MAALHLTRENYEEEVLQSDRPVLIDFWAEWCGPCRMLLPVIEELAGVVSDAKICKVNVDEQPELAEKFNVMTIPTLVVLKDQKIRHTSIGVKSRKAILEMLNA